MSCSTLGHEVLPSAYKPLALWTLPIRQGYLHVSKPGLTCMGTWRPRILAHKSPPSAKWCDQLLVEWVTCIESWNSPTTFPDNLSRYVFRSLYFRHHMKYWILMSFKITYAVKETSLLCMVKSYPIHEVPHPTPYRLFFNRFGVSRHRSIFNSFGIPMYQNWHSNRYTAVRKSATTQSHRLKYDQNWEPANLKIWKSQNLEKTRAQK